MKKDSENIFVNKRGLFVIALSLVILILIAWKTGVFVIAEQVGQSPESGAFSRLKSLSGELSSLGFGSTDSGSWGDWGADWNRIYSASIWVPSDATASTADVASGKTFYAGNNRVKQTGKELTADPPAPITPTVGDASYFNTLYKAIDTLSYGSELTGSWGNWGSMWNRIYSSATWTPSDATATVNDVKAGETFYAGNNNRTLQTGTSLGAGDGSDGSLTLTSTKNLNTESIGASSDDNGSYADGIAYRVSGISGSTITTNTNAPGLVADDKVILVDMQGTSDDYGSVGNYEELTISSVSSDTINLTSSPTKDYDGSGNSYSNQIVIIQRVPQYSNVTINNGGLVTASAWNGAGTAPTGDAGFHTGLVAFFVDGDLTINVGGSINVTGLGYRGGTLSSPGYNWGGDGFVGESIDGGYQNTQSTSANLGGGGAGLYGGDGTTPGGAGGALATAGTNGTLGSGHGLAGSVNGDSNKLLLGSAGGSGSGWISGGGDWMHSQGGNGGGSIYVAASTFINNGIINTNGLAGDDSRYRYSGFGGSGGGSGGTVFIQTWTYANNATITCVGANGNYGSNSNFSSGNGGNGGDGRINVVVGSYLTTTSSYASGGTITYSNGYYIHTFTTDGTFTPTSSRNVEVLVVAGGGGGGSSRSSYGGGGGGGAGGLIYNSSYAVSSGTPISITVGNGGSGGANNGSQKGGNGGDSIFGSLTAIGGGAGGSGTLDAPNIGGSGGGGGYWMYDYEAGAARTAGQGYAGGGNGATSGAGGGGGGGAGSTGYLPSNTPLHNGGIGGIGLEYNISGTLVYYAGGGCGGSYCIGGLGGGGANILNRPLNGLANRGGGGAGAYAEAGKAGDGGSGVVIIRYQP